MIDENLLSYFPFNDPNHSQAYIDAMKALRTIDRSTNNLQYHHSMIDDDNVNDSIKTKILYNELMTLRTELSKTERTLRNEISYLAAENRNLIIENKRLNDEIVSIKQTLYFG